MKSTLIPAQGFVVSEVELIYKSKVKASQRPQINSSGDAYQVFLQSWDDGKVELLEQFRVMYLNRANKVLGIYLLSSGGITGTIADPRLILAAALKIGTTNGILLCHCHPSGNLKPSHADEELTHKIKNAAKYFDIKVLDHLIFSNEGYYSFADEGLL